MTDFFALAFFAPLSSPGAGKVYLSSDSSIDSSLDSSSPEVRLIGSLSVLTGFESLVKTGFWSFLLEEVVVTVLLLEKFSLSKTFLISFFGLSSSDSFTFSFSNFLFEVSFSVSFDGVGAAPKFNLLYANLEAEAVTFFGGIQY